MRSVQILSFFFIVLVLLTSCSGYRKMSVNDYDMHYGQMNLERESENYYKDFTFYVNRDSDVYMLVAPQFVHQEDSVAITGILKEVKKDVIGENLLETDPSKILRKNKYNRTLINVHNDTLSLDAGQIITLTNKNVEKMTIYTLSEEQSSYNLDSKIAWAIIISAAVIGLITWVAVELNSLHNSLGKW